MIELNKYLIKRTQEYYPQQRNYQEDFYDKEVARANKLSPTQEVVVLVTHNDEPPMSQESMSDARPSTTESKIIQL